ncbi:MAG: hypothetical protein AAFX05_15025, partial [Planctomycetota bacterium]
DLAIALEIKDADAVEIKRSILTRLVDAPRSSSRPSRASEASDDDAGDRALASEMKDVLGRLLERGQLSPEMLERIMRELLGPRE